MSSGEPPRIGTIGWIDLTVRDAGRLRDFYSDVVGWSAVPVDMGGYEDYTMVPAHSSDPAAGICHARGPNASLPSQWLIYIVVGDLEQSLAAVIRGGGRVLVEPKELGPMGRYAVIEDPAGAVCALYQAAG